MCQWVKTLAPLTLIAIVAAPVGADPFPHPARWHRPTPNHRRLVYYDGPPALSRRAQAKWIVGRACRKAGGRHFRRSVRDLIYAIDVVLKDRSGKIRKERTEHFHYLRCGKGRDRHLARIVRTRPEGLEVLAFDGTRCWGSLDGEPIGRKGRLKAEERLTRTVFWQLLPFRLQWPDMDLAYLGAAPVGKDWAYEIQATPTRGPLHGERFHFFFRLKDYRLLKVLVYKPGQPHWAPITVHVSNYVSTCGIRRPRLLRFVTVEGVVREVHLERLVYNTGQCWRLFAPPPGCYGGADARLPVKKKRGA